MLFSNSHLAAVSLAGLMVVAVDANPAKAVLNCNIYESSGNLVIETSGSLDSPSSTAITREPLDNKPAQRRLGHPLFRMNSLMVNKA
jgi:hypothetical protein